MKSTDLCICTIMLPIEIWLFIMSFLDHIDLIYLKRTSRYFKALIDKEYPPTLGETTLQSFINGKYLYITKEMLNDLSLYEIARYSDIRMVKFALRIVTESAYYFGGLNGAAEAGNIDNFNAILECGRSQNRFDCNYIHVDAYSICKGGLVELAKKYLWITSSTIDNFLLEAITYGHLELVKWFVEEKNAWRLNEGLYGASKYGFWPIIHYLIEQGATDWNLGLKGACFRGDISMIDFFITKGANDWNMGLEGAARGEKKEIINLMISKGAKTMNMIVALSPKIRAYLKTVHISHKA